MFRAKYNVPGYITVNAYLVKGSTYDGALNEFVLIDGEAGGSKCIANNCEILEVICCGGIIMLHSDL
jgi:hypothetical protein